MTSETVIRVALLFLKVREDCATDADACATVARNLGVSAAAVAHCVEVTATL